VSLKKFFVIKGLAASLALELTVVFMDFQMLSKLVLVHVAENKNHSSSFTSRYTILGVLTFFCKYYTVPVLTFAQRELYHDYITTLDF
jgi:hypothetical protein